MFRCLFHFELIFVYSGRWGLRFLLLHVDIIFPTPFVVETILSPLCVLSSPVKDQLTDAWVYF